MNLSDYNDQVIGSWERTDGSYTIVISKLSEDGKMVAEYLNPTPINIGKAGWRVNSDKLELFIELQDENYPGSLYQLSLDDDSNSLSGSYYQAVSKQYYDVVFKRVKQ